MTSNSIYPCIWFENNAEEAAQFYCSVFADSKILSQNSIVTNFELNGTKFMGLNGGPRYKAGSAISYYVYAESDSEIVRLFDLLSDGGSILMNLDKYAWSEKYAWFKDKFGVDWQLDISTIKGDQKIVPSLLFANEKFGRVSEAIKLYSNIFSDSKILLKAPYPTEANFPEGTLLFAQININGFLLNAMSSSIKHDFDFTPGNSFVIECKDQVEIDYFWSKLGEHGHYDMCGWLSDKFGVSWQIVPHILSKLMSDPEKSQRVIQAFMKMQKFDIQTLINA